MARRAVRSGTPPLQVLQKQGMHRLLPSRFSGGSGTVLGEIAEDDAMLVDIMLLDGATNDRVQGESHGLAGISPYELVYGIPNAHIIRAAFLHSSHFGSRFNDATRGAWYAAEKLETSIAEVTYHKARRLAEIVVPGLPSERPDREVSEYDDWQADFHAVFHRLEPAEAYAEYLQPEPVPECYAASQRLAKNLLEQRSNGIIYPSVRAPSVRAPSAKAEGGLCLACFRPALVYQPRQAARYELILRLVEGEYESEVVEVDL